MRKFRPVIMTVSSVQQVKRHLYENGYDCRYPIDDK